ncbi:MAG: hypothetical protein NTZ15_10340 [Burkholderiales bacterium]|jgi:hypothetical protein|nr:hypothetical protein [Burkholderiales bacterium]
MRSYPRTEFHVKRSFIDGISHPASLAIALAVLMAVLIGALWALWWPLGASLAWACFHASLRPLQYAETQHMVGALLVAAVVVGVGTLFGPVAAGFTSFTLLLPLGLAGLGLRGEPADAAYPSSL